MKFFSRIATSVVLMILFFATPAIAPAFAQTNQSAFPKYVSTETNPDVPQNLHSLTQIVTTEVISTMICQLSGVDVMHRNQSCLGIDPQTQRIGFVNHGRGLIGLTMKGIGFTFDIPIHSGDYIRYMANKFGPEKTYAADQKQGFGFLGLTPLLHLWSTFRNIVYMFFVIIFVLIGLAIMLRVQIDPRTVMTIENQLPKIIIGLILVTFSYAIAGFLIDLMWLLTFLIINILASADKPVPELVHTATINVFQFPLGYLNEVLKTTSGSSGIWSLAMGASQAIHAVIVSMFDNNGTALQAIIGSGEVQCASLLDFGCWFDKLGDHTLQFIMNGIIVYVIDTIAFLVIAIALFITMFRIWFMLLKSYIHILLEVILAPFYIAGGLIPGSSIGFGTWLRSMCSNLLAFPVTIFMFVLARVLLDSFFPNGANLNVTSADVAPGGSLFLPPLIGNPNSNGILNPLGAIISLGIIFAIPGILANIRKALQTIDLGLGAVAMQNAGTGGKIFGGTTSRAANIATAFKIDPLRATGLQRAISSIFR